MKFEFTGSSGKPVVRLTAPRKAPFPWVPRTSLLSSARLYNERMIACFIIPDPSLTQLVELPFIEAVLYSPTEVPTKYSTPVGFTWIAALWHDSGSSAPSITTQVGVAAVAFPV